MARTIKSFAEKIGLNEKQEKELRKMIAERKHSARTTKRTKVKKGQYFVFKMIQSMCKDCPNRESCEDWFNLGKVVIFDSKSKNCILKNKPEQLDEVI